MGLGLVGGIASAIGAIGKIGLGFAQNHQANQINPVYSPYQTSPYAQKELGMANQLYNGRMFGATDMERNILNSQANFGAQVGRNATDSGQALALAAASQGQTNQAFGNLQTQEQQNKYNLLGNLNSAYDKMTQEGDKVYQDKLQKYQIDSQQKAALRSAAFGNIFGAVSDLGSTAIQGEKLGWLGNKGGGMGSSAVGVPHE